MRSSECGCSLQDKYHLKLPPYPDTSQCVKIGSSSAGSSAGNSAGKSDPSQIRLNYDLAEKGGGLMEDSVDPDPMKQFDKWFQVRNTALLTCTICRLPGMWQGTEAVCVSPAPSTDTGAFSITGKDARLYLDMLCSALRPLRIYWSALHTVADMAQEAVDAKVLEEPNQMAIASADADGVPSVRMVLLKGYDERGFMFYSNYESRKARELANGHAALCMYWELLQRSVRPNLFFSR